MPGKDQPKLSLQDKASFFQVLHTVVKTGVSMPVVLHEQAKTMPGGAYKTVLNSIAAGAERGKSVAEVLKSTPGGLSALDINLIGAGEKTGSLPYVLKNMSKYYNSQYRLTRKLVSAVFIPSLVFVFACFIAALPTLFNSGLPAFIWESFVWIAGLALLIAGSRLYYINLRRRAESERSAGERIYRFPLWGKIERKIDFYRFSTLLNISISSGLGISESLNITASGVPNFLLKKEIFKARYMIEKRGMTLEQAFAGSKVLGPLTRRMILSGEISGTIVTQLEKLAAYTFEDITSHVDALVRTVKILSYLIASIFIISRIFMLSSSILGSIYTH